ncbi:MAG: hypothetical protein HYU68_00480 [Bacteroidetes bacterium]|nr:hypothetical protein [Bacteroidota bacterium]
MTIEEEKLKLEFESAHPSLMKLKPEINVSTIIEEWDEDLEQFVLVQPNRIEIHVNHPFIFDNRLVPTEFNGIKVTNITIDGAYPSEFFDDIEENEPTPFYRLEDPEKYINYVNKHIDSIRKQLLSPEMSKEEALDAITGDFTKHKIWFVDVVAKDKRDI